MRVEDERLDMIARDYGAEFAARIATLPLREWDGPVQSGFGAHLVRVDARTPVAGA
jgi:parvulin-like peptidyl-prolyl isomerase